MWCSVAVMNYFETRKYTAMHDMCKKIVYISETFFPDTIVNDSLVFFYLNYAIYCSAILYLK